MILIHEDERVQKFIDEHKNPIVIYFTAKWCASCKLIEEILEPLAAENVGQIHVLKIDVEKCPRMAVRFLVRSLPTVVLYWGGKVRQVIIGAKVANKSLYNALFEEDSNDDN